MGVWEGFGVVMEWKVSGGKDPTFGKTKITYRNSAKQSAEPFSAVPLSRPQNICLKCVWYFEIHLAL